MPVGLLIFFQALLERLLPPVNLNLMEVGSPPASMIKYKCCKCNENDVLKALTYCDDCRPPERPEIDVSRISRMAVRRYEAQEMDAERDQAVGYKRMYDDGNAKLCHELVNDPNAQYVMERMKRRGIVI